MRVAVNELTVQERRGYRANNERIDRNGCARGSDNTSGRGQGLISSIRGPGAHRKTCDHDSQSSRRVRAATRLVPIARSIGHDGVTSCRSRIRTPDRFPVREQLIGGGALMPGRLSIDSSGATCSSLSSHDRTK